MINLLYTESYGDYWLTKTNVKRLAKAVLYLLPAAWKMIVEQEY